MLHILLLILKIIGIVLLCILGVLLLCIACVLFVPVRYRIEAVRKEGEGEPPVTVTVKITWLLHFVNVLVRFNKSLSVRARLIFITFFRLPKREKRGVSGKSESGKGGKKRKKDRQPEPGSNTADEVTGTELPDREHKCRKSGTENESGKTMAEGTSALGTETEYREDGKAAEKKQSAEYSDGRKETDAPGATNKRENEADETEDDAESGKKPTLWEKLCAIPEILRGILGKIKSIFENIQYTIQNICDKIRSVSDTIQYYRGVIEGEPFRRSFALCKKELLTIFKQLKPDRFEVSLIVGMDDPAATGEILAVCGMLYPVLGPGVNVVGDFEKKRLEGRVFIRGKLRFFTFVRVAVRVYFNKDIRKLYGLLKKEAV